MDHFPPSLKKALVRCVIVLGALAVFIGLCTYAIDARIRTARAPSCQWNAVPNPDAVPYAASWCKLTKGTVLLRLYDVKENRLLVERSYRHFDRPNFYWQSDGLGYDSQSDGDLIALPPSIFERLRAQLPWSGST